MSDSPRVVNRPAPESPLLPLEQHDLTEQTYQVLKERILHRQLKPGARVSVDDIAQQLRVSRTPVTAALKRLAIEGLVEIIPRRGTFVSSLTARDVEELFVVRAVIELYAARCILRDGKTDEFLRRIDGPMAKMRQASETDEYTDYPAFMEGDRDFHLALVDLTGNSRLAVVYAELNVHIQVSRAHYLNTVEDAMQALREHEAVIAAFRSRDPQAVEEALELHISNVKDRIVELLSGHGGRL
ncbi:MAG TPA: GntR family transcriptional regulator [Anaerolineales bacterium]|nr:GntR family transcriptional regulator [Anaerolineales bacterium]